MGSSEDHDQTKPIDPVPDYEAPPPVDANPTWTVLSVIPHDGHEPPANLSNTDGLAIWTTVSAPWHPAILARCASIPQIEGVESQTSPRPGEVRLIAQGFADRITSAFQELVEGSGAVILDSGLDRLELAKRILEAIGEPLPEDLDKEGTDLLADFLALGTAHWWLRDLTVAMNHTDCLAHERFSTEVLSAAKAWMERDWNTSKNHLRAAFEKLTDARERYYPVDAYIVDICLLDPAMPGGVLTDALDARAPITFLAPASAIENQAERDPESMARLREAIGEGWADVAGGAYSEAEEGLLPLESIFWQFRHGGKVYRDHLDNRNVETVARRRFGLYPQLPQVGKRFGCRVAIHLGFDAGRFPIRIEAKRLWEAPEHTNLETLTRPPLAAEPASMAVYLPWKLSVSMKDDHVATLPIVHWPNVPNGWYHDLRRTLLYSPVLARSVTLNDYFHLTDRPYENFAPTLDEYETPYLAQAVARKSPEPISRKVDHAALRARFEGLVALNAVAEALGVVFPRSERPLAQIETSFETDKLDAANRAIAEREAVWPAAIARGLVGTKTDGRPGFLVINPAGVARRVAVLLPDAALDLRPEGPLRAAQFTEDGVWGVVEVAAYGFAWVPRDSNFDAAPSPIGILSAKGQRLKNESMTVDIDSASGGIRGVMALADETARLGQQLVIHGLVGPEGQPAPSKMRSDSFEVEYGGPALVQAVSKGVILGPDERELVKFKQRFRLWTGRPVLEIDIHLDDLDPTWLASLADADPWSKFLSCRWAWPDPMSALRRTSLLHPQSTESNRPETPDAFDISTRRQRTTLLFGGLAHHQRHGRRMLDTILVAGRETRRDFRLGVVLDLEHPFHASTDMLAPAYVVPTEAGPPKTGPAGWLFQLDNKGVAVTRVEYIDEVDESRGWGLAFDMLETTGKSGRCKLRFFRNPTWAKQTDFQGSIIIDLPVDGDSTLIDFTPHELARVEVGFN